MIQPLLTTDEIAKILKITEPIARKYCRDGKIRAVKQGGEYRITEANLREYINSL